MADPAANNWPAPRASRPTFGLLASIPANKAGRWQSGITYTPEGCVEGTTLELYATGQKTPSDHPDIVTWIPYILSTYTQCSTFSGDEENAGRARRSLLADSERQLATELWEGNIASAGTWQGAAYPNTWLANAPLTLEGTAIPALQGLYCLDAYLAHNNSGQQGVIHAPVEAFDTWKSLQAIIEQDGKWYSPTGHLVVTSPGYPGTEPDGTAYPAGLWAYATDMIRIFMEDVRVPSEQFQRIDRRDNTVAILAERRALAEWSRCRHAAVEMDVDTCDLV